MTIYSTRNLKEFEGMLLTQKKLKTMISEGDSWFGYPAKGTLLQHTGANIIDHVEKTKRFNILRMESSGDEAGAIMSQGQRHTFQNVLTKLRQKGKTPDYILFSAGGNDIVGEYDMPHFLNDWQAGMTPKQCVREEWFGLRLEQIRCAYEELILFRNEYCKEAWIITHGYDNPIPTDKKSVLIPGVVVLDPWIKPYMDQKGIPAGAMQQEVIKIMIGRLNDMLDALAKKSQRMVKVETVGTLQAGDWRDEIHANTPGFKKIADKFIAAIDNIESGQI